MIKFEDHATHCRTVKITKMEEVPIPKRDDNYTDSVWYRLLILVRSRTKKVYMTFSFNLSNLALTL